MCGIAGILRTGERPLPPPAVVRRMIASIDYRGPDDSGEYLDADVQLAVVRLAIIDLKGGRQPATGRDPRIVSVYNGEIYNYQDLRRRVRERGHALPDSCDSTVVPHLYEEEGDDLVRSLRGMYAFAVWDGRKRRLLLARDRLGIKPLYYAQTPDYLIFGSEIKAILASGLVDAEIDRRSLDDLFSLSYPCPPRTLFRDVVELRPAHVMSARAGAPADPPRRYWRAPFPARGGHRRGRRSDLEAELRDLLERRVYDHLQADVKVGTFLSGGLDSSAIAALVKRVTGDPPVTFTVGFSTPEHDERSYAAAMVEFLGSENHTVVCDASSAELLPRMLWHTELPLQFPLALPLLQLSGLAGSRGFPVILTGEGADETMGGYDCFRGQRMRRVFDRPGLRSLRAPAYRRLYRWLGAPEGAVERILEVQTRPAADVMREFSGVIPAWYEAWQVFDLERDLLLAPDGRVVRPLGAAPEGFAALVREDVADLDPLDAQLALEVETRLPSWILLIGDRAAMANSVETRVPLLDHELVELVASLPPSLKMRGFTEKAILRDALRGVVPESIRRRQKKPFYTPIQEWFFAPGAPGFVEDMLSERALRDAGLFAPEVVKKLRQDLDLVPRGHLLRLQLEWTLLQVLGTQLVHRLFVADFDPTRRAAAL